MPEVIVATGWLFFLTLFGLGIYKLLKGVASLLEGLAYCVGEVVDQVFAVDDED